MLLSEETDKSSKETATVFDLVNIYNMHCNMEIICRTINMALKKQEMTQN